MQKVMKVFFFGYSLTSKAFKVFNKRTLVVEESIHVIFDESNPPSRKDSLDDDDVGILQEDIDEPSQEKEKDQEEIKDDESKEEKLNEPQVIEKEPSFPRERLYVNDGKIIGDPNQGVKTRSSYRNICEYVSSLSQLEPKNIKEALNDDHWIVAMQEKLNQFERSKVWNLVPRPNDHSIIGTKWIFRNKMMKIATLLGIRLD